jgi:hypothetical protein
LACLAGGGGAVGLRQSGSLDCCVWPASSLPPPCNQQQQKKIGQYLVGGVSACAGPVAPPPEGPLHVQMRWCCAVPSVQQAQQRAAQTALCRTPWRCVLLACRNDSSSGDGSSSSSSSVSATVCSAVEVEGDGLSCTMHAQDMNPGWQPGEKATASSANAWFKHRSVLRCPCISCRLVASMAPLLQQWRPSYQRPRRSCSAATMSTMLEPAIMQGTIHNVFAACLLSSLIHKQQLAACPRTSCGRC